MRMNPSKLHSWRKVAVIIVLAQCLVAGMIATHAYLDYRTERDRLIMGDLLTLRFMTLGKEYDKSFKSSFYDVGLEVISGLRSGQMPAPTRPDFTKIGTRTIEVLMFQDIISSKNTELYGILNGPDDLILRERGDEVYVAGKLYRGGEKDPYGIIRISNTPKGLLRTCFRRNLLIYLLIFLLINGQAALFGLLVTRHRDVVWEKGYLKEHALGALKLQHKILGDIIADHDESHPREEENHNVVSFPPREN